MQYKLLIFPEERSGGGDGGGGGGGGSSSISSSTGGRTYCNKGIAGNVYNRATVDGRVCKKYGVPYGEKNLIKFNRIMFKELLIVLLFAIQIICIPAATTDVEFFPGLRKTRPIQQWQLNEEESNYLFAQLNSIIEGEARRRYLNKLQQQQQLQQFKDENHYYDRVLPQQHANNDNNVINNNNINSHQHGPSVSQEIAAPGFTYQFPKTSKIQQNDRDKLPSFGMNPSDAGYYKKQLVNSDGNNNNSNNKNINNNNNNNNYEEDYQELLAKAATIDDDKTIKSSDGIPSYKLKSPMEINPKISHASVDDNNLSSKSTNVQARDDLQLLVEKLQKNGQEGAIINTNNMNYQNQNNGSNISHRNDVIKKHLEMDAAVGMYFVALIAGVSAACTVALIWLGIAWYTLSKKAKAAADVEYPAYGVTGPNKDQSPNGDRRLAQSAQMYHYQHQKQQIIAMENRVSGERNGSLSEVESDDENEEGDYTVYECPGLAPTGEMEVKNPLFLDDPTPATPGNGVVTATSIQQQQQQQQKSGNTQSSSAASSSAPTPATTTIIKSGSNTTTNNSQKSPKNVVNNNNNNNNNNNTNNNQQQQSDEKKK